MKIVIFGGGSGVGLAAAKLLAARATFDGKFWVHLPAGRVGSAEDIARAVQFVIDSPFMTGTTLCVDGGLPHSKL